VDVSGLLGLISAAAGVLALLAMYRWQRQTKGFGYAVLTNRSLLALESPFAVSLHHNGNAVREPRLVVVRLANTGNVPIQPTEFERSVVFIFPECKVLSAEVTGVRPDGLTASLQAAGPTVVIEPCLLNPADVIEVQCLLDGRLTRPRVECRIAGVQSVRRVELPRDSWGNIWQVSFGDFVLFNFVTLLLALGAFGFFVNGGELELLLASP
jgi:hypothetical protein